MKGIYLVAILYVVTLSVVALNESPVADIPTDCPDVNPRNRTIFVPHETDCTKFYSCHMGKKGQPLDCPFMDKEGNRLHFNPRLQVCDWPQSARCKISSSPMPTTLSPTSPTPTTPSPTSPTPTTPSPTSPTPTTPSPTSPTPTTPSPTSPTPTTPSPTSPTPTTPSPTSPMPTTPSSTSPTPTTPSPTSPTPTTPSLTSPTPTTPSPTTPMPTTPSPTSPTPTIPSSTSPVPTTMSSSSSPTPTTPSSSSCGFDGVVHLIPHKTMCDYYYSCFNGVVNPTPQKCDRNLLFNPVLRVCDFPENVKCSSTIPPSTDIVPSTIRSLITIMTLQNPSSTPQFFPLPTKSVAPFAWICMPSDKRYKVPHEFMCDHFYWCVNGRKGTEPVKCESNLLFNPVVGQCDNPENVDCKTTTKKYPTTTTTKKYFTTTTTKKYPTTTTTKKYPTTTTTTKPSITTTKKYSTTTITTESPTTTTTKKPSTTTKEPTTTPRDRNKPREKCPPRGSTEKVRIAHPCLCNQYYECMDGEKILETCPIGKHFDYVREVCDWASIVKCIRPIPPFDILIDNFDTTCAPEGRAFQHETDCSAYYLCSKGEKILKHCIEGLHFNISIQMCDYPQKKCDLTTPLPTVTLSVCPPAGSIEKIFLPHECECTQYYECIDGKQTLRDCLDGLHYDYVRQICSEPNEAKCTNLAPTVPTKWSSSNPDSDRCYDEDSEMSHEYNCSSYYKCNNGKKILKTCPRNLYFNSKLRVCDFPENVACDTGSANLPIMPTSTKCHMTIEITKIPHEIDCNLYYVCENGINTLKKCHSPELVFNPVLQICDFPENYICNLTHTQNDLKEIDETMIQNLDPSTCIGTCPEEDPEYAVLLPNDDCKKFCMCSNGLAYVQPCPEPLYFDSVDKVCKQKKDAVCAIRSFDRSLTNDRIFDENDSTMSLSEENYSEREIYNNPWYKRRFYNVEPSTCIGICPEEEFEYAILLPHVDCRKFCMCSNGLAYIRLCPEPLYFHSVDKVCRRKTHAVCAIHSFKRNHATIINREDEEDNSIEFFSEEENNNKRKRHNYLWSKPYFYNFNPSTCIGICSEYDSMYTVLHPNKDCKKFCICNNGVTWIQSCPEPLYFDSIHKMCKQKRDAVCAVHMYSRNHALTIDKETDENDRIQILSEENTDENKICDIKLDSYNLDTCIGICSDEDNAALLPNLDCRKFCICSSGQAWVQSCPELFYFDSVDKICKLKKNAICAINLINKNRAFIFNKVDENNLIIPLSKKKRHEHATRDNIWFKLYSSTHQSHNNLDPSTCIGACPEKDPEYAVLLPNDDCKKFCMCSNGFAWIMSCPEPLYFDSVEKICKGKKDAVCGKRLFSQDDAFKIDTMVKNDNSLKSLADENKYGIYNNPSTCIGTCPEEDPEYAVLLPNDDCKKFCMCSNGFAWVQSCPEPLYFDSVQKICKVKKEAVCGKRSFSQDDTFRIDRMVENDTSLQSIVDQDKYGIYNDPSTCIGTCPKKDPEYAVLLPNDDCKKFCMCSNGFAWVMSCPEPLYFDSVEKICKGKDAVCGKRLFNQDDAFRINAMVENDNSLKSLTDGNNKHGTYNLDPSSCIGTCPEEDPEYAVLLPNDDCKKFCMCSNGFAWVQSCPEPLYFDSVQKICKVKKEAICGKRSFSQDDTFRIDRIVDNDNTLKSLTDGNNNKHGTYNNLNSSTCIGTCPEEDPEYAVLLPNDDCKKFCMCSNGFAWIQSCPEPLYFDSVEKICKGKKDAVCGKRLFSQDDAFRIDTMVENDNSLQSLVDQDKYGIYNDPSTCIGTCPKKDPEYAVLLPNDDCKKFCMCSNGFAWVMSCPEPLYFDSVEKICKGKDAVCGKRLFNQDDAFRINAMVENDNSLKSLIDGNNKHGTYNLDPSSCIGTCPEEDPEYAILLPNDDCKKFCMCSNGFAWVQSCPEPLYFDSVQKICKVKKEAVCGKRLFNQDDAFRIDTMVENDNSLQSLVDQNKYGIYNDPSTCIGTCPKKDPEYAVLLPNDDCKKFCMCSNGFAWVMSCPEPLYFDSVEKICKVKKEAICGKRSFSQDDAFRINAMVENDNSLKSLIDGNNKHGTYNLDPSSCIGTCPEEDPEYAVLLPNDDCKKFCMCSNGFAWVQSCPEPLYFDSVQKICKVKKEAVCGKRLFNQDDAFRIDTMVENDNSLQSLVDQNKYGIYNDPSTCIGTCPKKDPEYAVLLPNDDCKKFCMCSNGFAWVMSCPEPLYFDSVEKICKGKDAVCGKRLFSQDDAFRINAMIENDNSLKSLIDGNNKHETYNLNPSSCIGTCPEEDPEYAVLLPNDDCKKFCMCSKGFAWVQSCPEPLYFDSIQKVCKRKIDAVCVVRLFNEDRIFTVDKK